MNRQVRSKHTAGGFIYIGAKIVIALFTNDSGLIDQHTGLAVSDLSHCNYHIMRSTITSNKRTALGAIAHADCGRVTEHTYVVVISIVLIAIAQRDVCP